AAQQNPQPRIEPDGELAAAAKDVAAQAKSTVDGANNPVPTNIAQSVPGQSPLPLVVAIVVSLLAILMIRQLRRR
ncbi:MAG TPA: nucleoid-structuring protein H-NS, partial [Mycobacterium sp.]|nr:nucleoid-structuring protein H-NS [Mycobacterium sp.]